MSIAFASIGVFALIAVICLLGFSETVLVEMGVHRLSKLLAGEKGDVGFTPEELLSLLTTILLARLSSVLGLGALSVLWALQFGSRVWVELVAFVGLGIVLILGDTLARRHARAKAEKAAGRVLVWIRRMTWALSPFVGVVSFLTAPFSPTRVEQVGSLEDLHDQILDLQSKGVLKETQTQIFQSLLEFGETIAREVMVPRVDMICTKIGTPLTEVLSLMHENGYSRVPVCRESIDDILGFVYVKDLIAAFDNLERPLGTADLRDALVVPGTRKVGEILRDLQARHCALAVVLDEYGGTDGLLTVEDILEELVGEINDEYDDEATEVEHYEDGSVKIDAAMIVEDVNTQFDIDIPTDGPETLGGYLYDLFGHAPEVGESVEVDGVLFLVEGVKRNRITWVKVKRRLDSEESEQERVA